MKYLVLVFFLSHIMWSQNLDKHLWENRVIVISADKKNETRATEQFNILKTEKDRLTDRRLVVYKCIGDICKYYDFKKDAKVVLVDKKLTGFNVVLLGLDGGKKFNSNKVENANVFFNLIDKMPMRRQELRNKKND
ncbi:DUF4174 domain-containing protein [Hyunsoonleella pacifica]|uniref:DUF4174 domain-containing protein n=1 Tax=Hyunsoonleella pacifica TaxID=1080224 RepID=A0A4Q9FMP1_9FLAO|nr:DUF4174 domain-containing protein [Hyunsoonleella pacifica]TBN15608.1 DUF4174 domain-containing protein [Hyunsoonleella pacifica]